MWWTTTIKRLFNLDLALKLWIFHFILELTVLYFKVLLTQMTQTVIRFPAPLRHLIKTCIKLNYLMNIKRQEMILHKDSQREHSHFASSRSDMEYKKTKLSCFCMAFKMLKHRENIFSASWLHCPSSHGGEMVHSCFTFQIKTDTPGCRFKTSITDLGNVPQNKVLDFPCTWEKFSSKLKI